MHLAKHKGVILHTSLLLLSNIYATQPILASWNMITPNSDKIRWNSKSICSQPSNNTAQSVSPHSSYTYNTNSWNHPLPSYLLIYGWNPIPNCCPHEKGHPDLLLETHSHPCYPWPNKWILTQNLLSQGQLPFNGNISALTDLHFIQVFHETKHFH